MESESFKCPKCLICKDTLTDGNLYKINTDQGDKYLCNMCFNYQIINQETRSWDIKDESDYENCVCCPDLETCCFNEERSEKE